MTLRIRLAALLVAATLAGPGVAETLPYGVAAGDVAQTSVVLWAQPRVAGPMTFEISTSPDFSDVVARRKVEADTATVPRKVRIGGLLAGTGYHYRVTNGRSTFTGRFRTLPPACAGANVDFGVTGDWRSELAPYPAVRNIVTADLDFLVALGDTIYAENYSDPTDPTAATLPAYQARYRASLTRTAGMNAWPLIRRKTVLFSMIDDHEVVNDFAGGASPLTDDRFDGGVAYINQTKRYEAGLTAFGQYMPTAEATWTAGAGDRFADRPRLMRVRTLGRTAMFAMVDARSFRDQGLPAVRSLSDKAEVTNFLVRSFDPNRTMLGRPQVDALKTAILDAHRKGTVWKFVFMPEPIQNLGVLAASDRFEGYAAERSEILGFIKANDIRNVVFVTADMHGTLTNNLTYQSQPGGPQIPVPSFEIITGAVAFDAPLGPTVVGLAHQLGLISDAQKAFYESLPVAGDADGLPNDKDDFLRALIDQQVSALGYDTLGLDGSGLAAKLEVGGYEAAHSYGWTEFKVDGTTGRLTVITWGIAPYTAEDIAADPVGVTSRQPTIVSQFSVAPEAVPAGACPR